MQERFSVNELVGKHVVPSTTAMSQFPVQSSIQCSSQCLQQQNCVALVHLKNDRYRTILLLTIILFPQKGSIALLVILTNHSVKYLQHNTLESTFVANVIANTALLYLILLVF